MVVRLAANKYVYLLPFIQKLWTSIENISWYLCLGFRRVVFEVKKSIFVTSYFNSLLLFFFFKMLAFSKFFRFDNQINRPIRTLVEYHSLKKIVLFPSLLQLFLPIQWVHFLKSNDYLNVTFFATLFFWMLQLRSHKINRNYCLVILFSDL